MGLENYIDARTDTVGDTIDGSICVVGAGAAGLTLVRRLAQSVSGVVLIESGGHELDGATQALYSGQMLGLPYYDLTASRLRYFGGTTNHWGGYCRTYHQIDYEARPSLGLPGWPVSEAELQPFIVEAARDLGIQDPFLAPAALLNSVGIAADDLAEHSSAKLRARIVQIAKDIRLGPKHGDEIAASPNVRVYLNLNAVHIQLAPDATSVAHLECATLTGKRITVTARLFVLCCHAIENARLLLTSNDVESNGIGNRFDHVGRYFMDHIDVFASKFIPTDAFPNLYNFDFGKAHAMAATLGFNDRTVREHDLLQYSCRFNPVYAEPETAEAIERIRRDFMEPGDISFLRDVSTAVADLSAVPSYVAARRKIYFAKPLYYSLQHHVDQAPNPSSRVVISTRRDALGSLIADLDWRVVEADCRSFSSGQDLVGAELAALGWGRMMQDEITPELVRSQVFGEYHQIGTTRMSAAAPGGVVDADCRVHGISNLYVGGSSVFPSAGSAGPTMIIIAFALRLSAHLAGRLIR